MVEVKLFGDPSYVMDLMRANPGFNWLGKGMVLRLPKMDPRLTRKRKIKRRMKDYIPPPEETEEQIDWWDDPAFEEEMADVFAETALSIGLDENVLRDELGLGEGSPLLKEAPSKNWTQSRTEKGNLHSQRTSPDREGRSQTGESSQTATGSTTPPITLTDEQIDTLKANLEKLGLDVDVAMAELGLGEGAAASTTASQTTSLGGDKPPVGDGAGMSGGAVKDFKPPKPPAGDVEQDEPPQEPTPTPGDTGKGEKSWWEKLIEGLLDLLGISGKEEEMISDELRKGLKYWEEYNTFKSKPQEGFFNQTPQPTLTATPEPDSFTYTVIDGDNLYSIAKFYLGNDSSIADQNALIEDIKKWNPGVADKISIGEEIVIPRFYSERYIYPIETYAPIQGSFFQVLPYEHGTDIGDGRIHPGVDIKAEDPTIRANAEGKVYFFQATSYGVVTYSPNTDKTDLEDYGNYAVLVSEIEGKTYYQVFAHMDDFNGDITQGQSVDAGTVLGTMGNTGASDYPHVHWEIRLEENVVIEVDSKGNSIYMFNNLPVNGYYLNNQAELDQLTIDPADFADLLSDGN